MSYDGTGAARECHRAGDRGQAAIEYLGFVPILILVALAAVQLGLVAYTAQQAGTAARAGARSASLDEDAQQGCRNAVSGWLADGTACASAELGDEVRVTADVDIPRSCPAGTSARPTRPRRCRSTTERRAQDDHEPAGTHQRPRGARQPG